MFLRSGAALVVAFLTNGLRAQTPTSLSDCHNHGATRCVENKRSVIERDLALTVLNPRYCVLPNGEETAVPSSITEAPSVATAVPAVADAQTTAVTSCHMHETAQ